MNVKCTFQVDDDNSVITATLVMPTWELALIRLQEDDPLWHANNEPKIIAIVEVNEPQTPWGELDIKWEEKK